MGAELRLGAHEDVTAVEEWADSVTVHPRPGLSDPFVLDTAEARAAFRALAGGALPHARWRAADPACLELARHFGRLTRARLPAWWCGISEDEARSGKVLPVDPLPREQPKARLSQNCAWRARRLQLLHAGVAIEALPPATTDLGLSG